MPKYLNSSAQFFVGQLVVHRLFDYRGVIYDVDPCFQGSEAWYEQMARTNPPRDAPWYRVLVHNGTHETYVAEQNLMPDPAPRPIRHPSLDEIFADFDGAVYRTRRHDN